MFHLIRQNAQGSAAVLIRMLEVLASVAGCERDPARLAALQRHADLVLGDAERDVGTPSDLADVKARHRRFAAIRQDGPAGRSDSRSRAHCHPLTRRLHYDEFGRCGRPFGHRRPQAFGHQPSLLSGRTLARANPMFRQPARLPR